jgi:hypothetical protein
MLESVTQSNAANTGRATAYNGGSLRFYTGSRPASVAAGIGSATLLATLTFGATAFASHTNRVSTANAITGANAIANGTIGFAAVFAADGTTLVSLHTVGTSGSGAECIVNSTTCTTGIAVSCSSFTLTQPDGS